MIGVTTRIGLVIRMRAECYELMKEDIARYNSYDDFLLDLVLHSRNRNFSRESIETVRTKVKTKLDSNSITKGGTFKEFPIPHYKSATWHFINIECIKQGIRPLEYLERATYVKLGVA